MRIDTNRITDPDCVSEVTWDDKEIETIKEFVIPTFHANIKNSFFSYAYRISRWCLSILPKHALDIELTNLGLNYNKYTMRFQETQTQHSYDRYFITQFGYMQQLICLIVPTIIFASIQIWESVQSSPPYFICHLIVFIVYAMTCTGYLITLKSLSDKLSTIAAINTDDFRKNLHHRSRRNHNGEEFLEIMGNNRSSSLVQLQEKQELDNLSILAARLGCLVFILFIFWIDLLAFSALYHPKRDSIICFAKTMPAVAFWSMKCIPTIIALMMPLSFRVAIVIEIVQTVLVAIYMNMSIGLHSLSGGVILPFAFVSVSPWLVQWSISKQYLHMFILRVILSKQAMKFERKTLKQYLRNQTEFSKVLSLPPWQTSAEFLAYYEMLRSTMQYNLITLEFYRQDLQSRFADARLSVYNAELVNYFMGVYVLIFVSSVLALSISYIEDSRAGMPWSWFEIFLYVIVITIPEIASVVFGLYLKPAIGIAKKKVVDNVRTMCSLEEMHRRHNESVASNHQQELQENHQLIPQEGDENIVQIDLPMNSQHAREDSKSENTTTNVKMNYYANRVKWMSVVFMITSNIALLSIVIIKLIKGNCNGSFCMSKKISVVPLLALWVINFYFSLMIPYRWGHILVSEIFSKACIFGIFAHVLLANKSEEIGAAKVQFLTLFAMMILLNFFSLWSTMRIQLLAFIEQEIFLRIVIDQEKESLIDNFLWYLT